MGSRSCKSVESCGQFTRDHLNRLGSPTLAIGPRLRSYGRRSSMKSPNTSDTSGWEARVDLLQQQLDVLVAKDQIRDVLYRYARGVDRKDEALLKSCY